VIVAGGFMVLVDLIVNLAPPEVAITLLVLVGAITGIAVIARIEGLVVGLAMGGIVGAFAEATQSIISAQGSSGVEGFLLGNMFLWVGLLLFAAGFSSYASE